MDLNVLAPILEPLGLELQELAGLAGIVFALITALKVRFPIWFSGAWVDLGAIVLSIGIAALQYHALGTVPLIVAAASIYFGNLTGQGLFNKLATGATRGSKDPLAAVSIEDKRRGALGGGR